MQTYCSLGLPHHVLHAFKNLSLPTHQWLWRGEQSPQGVAGGRSQATRAHHRRIPGTTRTVGRYS